jgi:hypothetical protein
MNPCFKINGSSITQVLFGVLLAGTADAQTGVEIVDFPADQRIVTGVDTEQFIYELQEIGGNTEPNFNIQATLDGSGSPIIEMIYDNGLNTIQTLGGTQTGAGLFATNTATLNIRPNFTGFDAGSFIDLQVELTDQNGGGWSDSASTTFNVVDHRVLTGTATIDAGRHMIYQKIGELVISGGSGTEATRDYATDFIFNSGIQRTIGKTGVYSGSGFTFNDANQTYTLDISSTFNGTINTTLNGNQFLKPSTFHPDNSLTSFENIKGAGIDASGVSLTVTGEALRNRVVYDATQNLGRFMFNTTAPAGSVPATSTQMLTTTGADDAYTRLTVAAQNVGQAGDDVIVTTTGGLLNGPNATVDLAVTGNFAIDTSSTGHYSKTVDIALTEEGVTGENAQSSAKAGYNYTVVKRNEAVVPDIDLYAVKGTTGTINNESASLKYDTEFHTAIQLNDEGIDLTPLTQNSHFLDQGPTNLTRTISVQGEGLANEGSYADEDYNVALTVLEASDVQANIPEVGNSFSASNIRRVGGADPKKQAIAQISANGDRIWLNPNGTEAGLVVVMNDSYAEAGTTVTGSVQFIEQEYPFGVRPYRHTGFGEYYEEYFYVYQKDVGTVEGGEAVIGGVDRYLGRFLATHGTKGVAETGTIEWDLGYDFFGRQFTLTSDTKASIGQKKLELAFLDSEEIAEAGTVTATFLARAELDSGLTDSGTSGFDQLASDAVEITGLDGFQHVIQLNALSGQNEVAWYDPDNDAWINAVLGNSNIENLDLDAGTLVADGQSLQIDEYLDEMRFEGTYFEYLLSLNEQTDPVLGAFGAHADGSAVWAVIDHNSTFAVLIPEPNTALLIGLGCIGLLRRRAA